MSVIFILVILGVIVAGLFLAGFIWAVRNGQYEDTYTPSVRMLFDEQIQNEQETSSEILSKNKDETTVDNSEKSFKPKL